MFSRTSKNVVSGAGDDVSSSKSTPIGISGAGFVASSSKAADLGSELAPLGDPRRKLGALLKENWISCVEALRSLGLLLLYRINSILMPFGRRDLRPGQVGSIIHTSATSDSLLLSIQGKIKWADSMSELVKIHRKEIQEKFIDFVHNEAPAGVAQEVAQEWLKKLPQPSYDDKYVLNRNNKTRILNKDCSLACQV
ncbi:hypothetical protein V2J09_004075 [Rumex salicifolius]